MKNFSSISVLLVLLISGCVNVGNKVALIVDSDESLDSPKGGCFRLSIYKKKNASSLLIAVNEKLTYNHEILQRVIEKYNEENKFSKNDGDGVEVKLSFDRQLPDDSLDAYEFISGIFTFFTLGIWPTIMSDELHSTIKMQNNFQNITIPVIVKKRYVYGWLSLFPVPGVAAWRGNNDNIFSGEAEVIKNIVVSNLYKFNH